MYPGKDMQADAREADEGDFETHRGRLTGIAYRMLGSLMDAEDIAQEVYLKWRGVDRSRVASPHHYLNTITTRLCINQLRSARRKREEYIGPWLPEPALTDDTQENLEMDESLTMAFLILLENLSPVERAVYLLREVFDYRFADVADFTGKSEANCRQIHRRARGRIQVGRPRFSAPPEKQEELLARFARASRAGDMKGLLDILSRDIELISDGGGKVTAALRILRGARDVARFVLGSARKLLPPGMRTRKALINGRPGFVNEHEGRVHSVLTADVLDGQITRIYIVSNPDKLRKIAPA